MKKTKLLIGLIAASLILCSIDIKAQNNNNKNDLLWIKLKGKVEKLTITKFKGVDKFGEIQKGDMQVKYIYLFNESGNMIEGNTYNSYGSLNKKYTYKYDNKGNIIERNFYKSDGSLDKKYTRKYDDKGNEIESNMYNSNGSLDKKYTFKYDDKGNEIESNLYGSDGSLKYKDTYKYGDKGGKIKLELNRYNSDGSLYYKIIRKYDNKGNEELNTYNSDGSLKYKSTYDDYFSWIKDSIVYSESFRMEYYYYEFSNYELDYNKESFFSTSRNDAPKYDDKGNEIEFYTYNSDGSLYNKYTSKYDYDITGNWIKTTVFKNGIPQTIIEREITYY